MVSLFHLGGKRIQVSEPVISPAHNDRGALYDTAREETHK